MRDDFTKPTIDVLAKRVGYICSNPNCKKHTVGPNDEQNKATIIGVAAHIKAAAPGGPRYDINQTPEDRKHISNAIWLCSNCATLIDKDESKYPDSLLERWKLDAEREMTNKLAVINTSHQHIVGSPFLEADLIWVTGSRSPKGYSSKNLEKFGGNVIPAGAAAIMFWELDWRFNFVIYNNSSHPAYNISITQSYYIHFTHLSVLPKVNNLPPYASLDLEARFSDIIEGEHNEADVLILKRIPPQIEGLELKIAYLNEARESFATIVKIEEGNITSLKY